MDLFDVFLNILVHLFIDIVDRLLIHPFVRLGDLTPHQVVVQIHIRLDDRLPELIVFL